MSVQDIADFEAGVQKLCEFYKHKLLHCEIVGVLDNIKVDRQLGTIEAMRKKPEPEVPAPVQELGPKKSGSPILGEAKSG